MIDENGLGIFRVMKFTLNSGRECYALYGHTDPHGWCPLRLREEDILGGHPTVFPTQYDLENYVTKIWSRREEYCFFMSTQGIALIEHVKTLKL